MSLFMMWNRNHSKPLYMQVCSEYSQEDFNAQGKVKILTSRMQKL